jgi:SAM-dependent methyltransferase
MHPGGPENVLLEVTATDANFEEAAYLASNADVAAAVARTDFPNGFAHFDRYGRTEGRRMRTGATVDVLQARKLARLAGCFRTDMPFTRQGKAYDFLTAALREEMGIIETTNVSSHDYPPEMSALVSEFAGGLVLDFGAGKRNRYYENVVNLELGAYDTTDVIGVGEALPFVDNCFDAVISNAVLEHVKDPVRCASEMARVLKPGGKLWCSIAFMSPVHGYPNHFFNMTAQGVRTIFEKHLAIDEQTVPAIMGPIYSLRWIVHLWAAGLTGTVREEFLNMKLQDLLRPMPEIEQAEWVTKLSVDKNFELAACTAISAHKPL